MNQPRSLGQVFRDAFAIMGRRFGAFKCGLGLFAGNGYGRNLGHTLLAFGAILVGSEMLSSLALAGRGKGGALWLY